RGAGGPAEKAKDSKKTLSRLIAYFGVRRIQLGVVVLLAVISTVFGIVGPKLQGKVTTKLFEGFLAKFAAIRLNQPVPSLDFAYIERMLLFITGFYIISAGFRYVQQLVMSDVAQRIVFDIRRDVNDKLHRLPLSYFDARTHGEVMSRVTNDIDNIANTLQQSLSQFITSICTILGILVMMLSISPLLTLISLLTLPTAMLGTMRIVKASQKHFAGQQRELGALNGHVEEMYSGFKIIKSFDREDEAKQVFDGINHRLGESGWKAQFISGAVMPVMNFINNIGYVLICVVGGILTSRSIIDLGDIQAFIQYSRRFTMPISQLSNIANVLQSTLASAERVFEVLDEEELIPDREGARADWQPRGDVSFRDLQFGYAKGQLLMDGVNLDVPAGHTAAIVGPTGAGKTTLVNLLMRFYEINGGGITIDGVDLRDIRRGSLRKIFGMVLQDTWLFKGTIRENIAYGRLGASEEDICGAAEAAHADHFIRALPEGYDTVINEEASNLSQGEKQLLTIARAILSDPPILILDEATSSVDTRTEVYIQKAMNRLMKGRTNFVIAHRLSTIRDAEKIIVMNRGSIIESGTHGELMEKQGFYADLYNSQFAGDDPEEEIR
ncbi:MAG: ABC transporter ATP-binding protein, partial [Spirochaetales bacterium]|nr:ABC transporter ATP-binding protein [Spirochaetales bacterium]